MDVIQHLALGVAHRLPLRDKSRASVLMIVIKSLNRLLKLILFWKQNLSVTAPNVI